jgi:hypothetical protein
MLSNTAAMLAVPARMRSRAGASLLWHDTQAVPRDRVPEMAVARLAAAGSAVTCLRPQARGGAGLSGRSALAADQAKFAFQQPTSQKYAHKTTQIAAAGGGALGSHPARDPV